MARNEVIQFTRARFPDLASEEFRVVAIEKGGSGRRFYRIQAADGPSMVVVKYHPDRQENRRFAEVADFLDRSDVNVPHIFFHDHDEGLIWMQDLGQRDLWSFRDEPWSVRRGLYRSALRQGFLLHSSATREWDGSHPKLEIEFNENLYLWEQHYFLEHCLCGFFALSEERARRYVEAPNMRQMAAALAAEPRVLVHRDFQSQNVIIHGGEAWLIDFQGVRPGLAQYDLASLLYDPYVDLAPAQRDELLDHYKTIMADSGAPVPAAFDRIFLMCAAQRLMQALGAYGFLGLKSRRADFLHHIPAARRNLREVTSKMDGMDEFVSLLEELPENRG